MTNQPKGRKKHLVEGEVAEIKKSEKGLGLEKVGEGAGFFGSLLSGFKKKEKKSK